MVNEIEYSSRENQLLVHFRQGATYRYSKVPAHLLLQLVDMDNVSVGKFLHREIISKKDLYPYEKLTS